MASPLIVGAVAACANLLAIDGAVSVRAAADAGTDGSTIACGLPAGSRDCAACLEARCCDQASACAAADTCASYEGCDIPCGSDYACRSACALARRASTHENVALDQCVAAECESACGVLCGITASSTLPDAAAGCQDCVASHDCNAAQACGTSLECLEVLACAGGCPTPDCLAACGEGRDAGVGLIAALTSAIGSSCLVECKYGEHWECLGKVTNPLPKAPMIDLTITTQDTRTQAPLADVVVNACSPIDAACAHPLAHGVSDTKGITTLAVPLGGVGFVGHLEIASQPDAGVALVPILYFFGYRLSEPRFALTMNMVTPTQLADLVLAANVTLDPSRGTILVNTYDCEQQPAANVVVSTTGTDAASRLLYVAGTLLSSTATATGAPGLALVVNVPTTTVALTATPLATGAASSRTAVAVRPGMMSYVALFPN